MLTKCELSQTHSKGIPKYGIFSAASFLYIALARNYRLIDASIRQNPGYLG
jgi:hypothetical protein